MEHSLKFIRQKDVVPTTTGGNWIYSTYTQENSKDGYLRNEHVSKGTWRIRARVLFELAHLNSDAYVLKINLWDKSEVL